MISEKGIIFGWTVLENWIFTLPIELIKCLAISIFKVHSIRVCFMIKQKKASSNMAFFINNVTSLMAERYESIYTLKRNLRKKATHICTARRAGLKCGWNLWLGSICCSLTFGHGSVSCRNVIICVNLLKSSQILH